MIKFTVDSKVFKNAVEKAVAAINKKTVLFIFKTVHIHTNGKGIMKVCGTDLDHWAEVRCNVYSDLPGDIWIDIDDLKVIFKMSGEITFEESDAKISVKCGKKILNIPKYIDEDNVVSLPNVEKEDLILEVKESWLLDTVTRLSLFTDDGSKNNKMLDAFHFNTKNKRVEAVNGCCIGVREIKEEWIKKPVDGDDNLLLHNKCVPVFKKLMHKDSNNTVHIYQSEKYIRIECDEYTYIIRRVEGRYFNVDSFLSSEGDYSFMPERESILEIVRYDEELNKTLKEGTKKPVIFNYKNGRLYMYIYTDKYESLDTVEADHIMMDESLFVGFSTLYLMNAFSIVDSDRPICKGNGSKGPLIIAGDEFKFVVLPCHTTGLLDGMMEMLKKVA